MVKISRKSRGLKRPVTITIEEFFKRKRKRRIPKGVTWLENIEKTQKKRFPNVKGYLTKIVGAIKRPKTGPEATKIERFFKMKREGKIPKAVKELGEIESFRLDWWKRSQKYADELMRLEMRGIFGPVSSEKIEKLEAKKETVEKKLGLSRAEDEIIRDLKEVEKWGPEEYNRLFKRLTGVSNINRGDLLQLARKFGNKELEGKIKRVFTHGKKTILSPEEFDRFLDKKLSSAVKQASQGKIEPTVDRVISFIEEGHFVLPSEIEGYFKKRIPEEQFEKLTVALRNKREEIEDKLAKVVNKKLKR